MLGLFVRRLVGQAPGTGEGVERWPTMSDNKKKQNPHKKRKHGGNCDTDSWAIVVAAAAATAATMSTVAI